MITRARDRMAGPVFWVVGVLLVLVVVLGVGRLVPQEPVIALAIAVAVLMLGLTLADPTIIPLLAVPAMLVVARLRLGGAEISASDVVLFLAFWPAVALGQRPYSAALRSLLWLVTLYQAATLFTVVNSPYSANVVEWFHAGLLTGGALVVGWALGRAGRAPVALTLLMAGVIVIAVSTVAQGVANLGSGFEAVYPHFPFEMHKNFAGCVLGIRRADRVRPPALDAVATAADPRDVRPLLPGTAVHPVAAGDHRTGRRPRGCRPARVTRPASARSSSSSAVSVRSPSSPRSSATRSTPATSSTRCSSGSTGSRTRPTSGSPTRSSAPVCGGGTPTGST